jgi:hypothetical protein
MGPRASSMWDCSEMLPLQGQAQPHAFARTAKKGCKEVRARAPEGNLCAACLFSYALRR